jgi:hypothetical protein
MGDEIDGMRVSGIRKLECGMRKIRKSVCMRSYLILFVLVLVNQNFIGTRDEYEDDDEDEKENDNEEGNCRAVSLGFHEVSHEVMGVRNGDRGSRLTAYSTGIANCPFSFPHSAFRLPNSLASDY